MATSADTGRKGDRLVSVRQEQNANMTSEPLSAQSEFSDALILSAVYSGMPGSSGLGEMAFRWGDTAVELWEWGDTLGVQRRNTWAKGTSYKTIIGELLVDETMPAAVALRDIEITRDRPPLGELLAFAYADDESNRRIAELLLQLPETVLINLATQQGGLRSPAVVETLSRIAEKAWEHGVDIGSLVVRLGESTGNLLERLDSAFRGAIATSVFADYRDQSGKEERRREREEKLMPFLDEIQRTCGKWAEGKSWSHWPGGGGSIPPAGMVRLRQYVEQYVLIHDAIPSGVHYIPEGSDGPHKATSLTVDFDSLAEG